MNSDSPAQQLLPLIFGALQGKALALMAQTDIAGLLKDGSMELSGIAKATGTDTIALSRLMNVLKQLGLVSEHAGGEYACTELGALLQKDHDSSLHHYALLTNGHFALQMMEHMQRSLKSGGSCFEEIVGSSFYDGLQNNPEQAAVFDGAMREITAQDAPEILNAYDMSGVNSIIDLGGGQGMLLSALLQRYPQAHGTLFELPNVCVGAQSILQEHIDNKRCDIIPGNFLEAVPNDGEVYILKRVLSHFADKDAITLLSNIRKNISNDGRVLIIEPNINSLYGASFNLLMLLLMGGGIRGRKELDELFAETDLAFLNFIELKTELCIVEAVPV